MWKRLGLKFGKSKPAEALQHNIKCQREKAKKNSNAGESTNSAMDEFIKRIKAEIFRAITKSPTLQHKSGQKPPYLVMPS